MRIHRLFVLALSLVLILTVTGTAYAAVALPGDVLPMYDYTAAVSVDLSISNGKATSVGEIIPQSQSMRTRVVVRLQRLENSSWVTLGTWVGSNSAGISCASGTKSVASGYSYRTRVNGMVYNSSGEIIESVTMTSSTKHY